MDVWNYILGYRNTFLRPGLFIFPLNVIIICDVCVIHRGSRSTDRVRTAQCKKYHS